MSRHGDQSSVTGILPVTITATVVNDRVVLSRYAGWELVTTQLAEAGHGIIAVHTFARHELVVDPKA